MTTGNLYATTRKMARAVDPITSHIAADRLARSGRLRAIQAQVYEALRQFPDLTARELARAMVDAEPGARCQCCGHAKAEASLYDSCHKRLPELAEMGLIYQAGRRECDVSGELAQTWRTRATDEERGATAQGPAPLRPQGQETGKDGQI